MRQDDEKKIRGSGLGARGLHPTPNSPTHPAPTRREADGQRDVGAVMRPDLAEFEARLRGWGARPPATAAVEAARRLVNALPERARFPWLRLAAAAALILALLLGAWLGAPGRTPSPAAVAQATPPLPDNVMVFWIDPDTPVYFVMTPIGS